MDRACYIITALYLVVMAVFDKRTKKIPVWPGFACMVIISCMQLFFGREWSGWLPGIIVGIFIYFISRISRGRVGTGDAIVYTVTGLALGLFRNLELFMTSLFFASAAALVLIVVRRVGKNYALPFIPFTAVAFFILPCL